MRCTLVFVFSENHSDKKVLDPHERCSTPSCDPGESSCNNGKQTNLFRYLKFHDWKQPIVRQNSESFVRRSAVSSRETLSNGTNWSENHSHFAGKSCRRKSLQTQQKVVEIIYHSCLTKKVVFVLKDEEKETKKWGHSGLDSDRQPIVCTVSGKPQFLEVM